MSVFTKFFALLAAFFTMIFSPSATYEKKGDATIMTYNVMAGELTETRLDAVIRQIRAVDPDSFGLQEVKKGSKAYLEAAFGDYDTYSVSDETEYTTFDTLFWRKSKFRMISADHVFLSTTPGRPSTGWDANHRRMLQWVVLEDKETGCRFIHANTHLDNGGDTARTESVKMIEKYLGASEYPVVVSGDYNCRYTGDTIKSFAAMGWNNTMNMCGITSSKDTFHGYTGDDVNHSPIDHIFVKGVQSAKNWMIHKDTYNGTYPSDHFPLSVELHFDYTVTAKQNYNWIKNG